MKKRTKRDQNLLVPVERIEKAIIFIRGEKVLLDRDLAELYEDITNCDIPPLTY